MNDYSTTGVIWSTTASTTGTVVGHVMWNGQRVIDDDDGGTAGVREPRRPGPAPMPPAVMYADA